MLAYPNNDKQMYLDRVKFHREHDELQQGVGWESNGVTRGCAVGCTLHEYNHAKYPALLGVPEVLARLQDQIFESLPREDALLFPEQFLAAIPDYQTKTDLSLVWPKLAVWLLTDPDHGVIRFVQDTKFAQQKIAIENVAKLWQRVIDGGVVSRDEWRAARDAASYAARAARIVFWKAIRDKLLNLLETA